MNFVGGRLLGEDKAGVLIYQGHGLSRNSNGKASFGIIKITKYSVNTQNIGEAYINNVVPPKECQKGYPVEGEDKLALFWTPYKTKGSKVYFSLFPKACNYGLDYDLISQKTNIHKN